MNDDFERESSNLSQKKLLELDLMGRSSEHAKVSTLARLGKFRQAPPSI
jgi:hypothetical protein